MILRQKACNQFYSWYWNSNMTAVVAQKSWPSLFVMQYLAFPGWMMISLNRQDGYLNQQIILFRLQYERYSLKMHPESPFRSIVTPTPNLSEQRYTLRLVVVPCQYFPSPSPFFQPILPSPSSHISSVSVPHLLRRRIHTYCPASPQLCSFSSVFTAELVYHPHYLASPRRLHFHPPASLLRFSSHYLSSSRVLCRRCFSTFLDHIFSLICVVLYYTDLFDLLCPTFLTLCSDLIATLFFSLLERLFSLSVMFSLRSDLPRFFSTWLHSDMLQSDYSPQICIILFACSISYQLNSDWSAHDLVCLLRSALISSLVSAPYFVPLELLISLQITLRYVTHHLLLACIIT